MTLIDKIFAHARTAPDRPALTYFGSTYSYRTFAALILWAREQLAGAPRDHAAILYVDDMVLYWVLGIALRSLGVATVAGRGAEDLDQMGVGPLTVIFAGAEPWSDVAAAAARAGVPVIRAPAPTAQDVASTALRALERPAGEPTAGHVVLTSATTGVYKKVLADPAYEAEEVVDRVIQFPELGADTAVNMFNFGGWTAIAHFVPMIVWRLGGRVVFDNGADPWRALMARDMTMAYVHPALLAEILAAPAEIDLRNDGMTLVVIAGVLTETLWRAARERLTNDVRTTLGSTEAGCCAVTKIRTRDDLIWHDPHPPAATELIGDDGRATAVGEQGLMRVRLNRAARYLNDPEATDLFFRDGYFYPGDLAVRRADGRFALRGRVTGVINVLGAKIGTLPIELALQEALAAEAVHVFSQPTADGEEVHVVLQPGPPIAQAALVAALRTALPQVAGVRVHVVERFPRNNMGKIERVKLKAQLGIGAVAG